ncbi:MAG: TIM barrel protein [Verrucomicrobiota bacterium]
MKNQPSRRSFLRNTSLVAGATALASQAPEAFAGTTPTHPLGGRLYKSLKLGMVRIGNNSLTDRFKAAKEAGFGAVELSCPGNNIDEIKEAIAESGLPVDGSVCAEHWQIRHTDPDPDIRAKALEFLTGALRETKEVGGHSVLLVVGHGKDGPEEEIWGRSIENISQALPLAAELGVTILVENVWNHFCYDHGGGPDQTADKFARYIDDFQSPFVGMQFDIGNHWKYGNTGDWIRTLGKRIYKLDVKGFDRTAKDGQGSFTKIGEGNIDFADVRAALTEINFYGWCAAEVAGGDETRLKEVSDNMDRVFGLS